MVAFALLPIVTAAQINDTLSKPLTLEEPLSYALDHYPAVRASLEQVAAAQAGVALARAQYLPPLNGAYHASPGSRLILDCDPQS